MIRATALLLLCLSLTAALPYQKRGDEIEVQYKAYAARWSSVDKKLRDITRAKYPELYRKIAPTPTSRALVYGYQILPPIKFEAIAKQQDAKDFRASSTSYSWPRTDSLIQTEIGRVAGWEERLKKFETAPDNDKTGIIEGLVGEHSTMANNQVILNEHMTHNRFWQDAIHNDKKRFTTYTDLHDKVIERQNALDAQDSLKAAKLAAEIHAKSDFFARPKYLKISRSKLKNKKLTVVTVPLYTDIEDAKWLSEFKRAAEELWRVETPTEIFESRIDWKKVEVHPAPTKGEHLDIAKHVDKFPKDGAVLTTGAINPYEIPGRYIALGADEISNFVIAHKFGHLLGFIDGYFRGFHDLGKDGYEILEIVPDPYDIMTSPGSGRVFREHYLRILEN